MNLNQWLKAKKLSQAKFGAQLTPPVSQALVSQWIRGDTRVTLEYSLQIAQLTEDEVSPADCAEMYRAPGRPEPVSKKAPRKRRATAAPVEIAA